METTIEIIQIAINMPNVHSRQIEVSDYRLLILIKFKDSTSFCKSVLYNEEAALKQTLDIIKIKFDEQTRIANAQLDTHSSQIQH
jgi:hypothetical protein